MGMVDIFNYIKALKNTWLRKLETKDPKWIPILYAHFPTFRHLASFVIILQNVFIRYVDNVFWKDCLNAFSAAIKVTTFDDFLSEPAFYNSHINIDNKSFLKRKWLDKGISQICDLVKENGEFYNLKEFNELYQLNMCFFRTLWCH